MKQVKFYSATMAWVTSWRQFMVLYKCREQSPNFNLLKDNRIQIRTFNHWFSCNLSLFCLSLSGENESTESATIQTPSNPKAGGSSQGFTYLHANQTCWRRRLNLSSLVAGWSPTHRFLIPHLAFIWIHLTYFTCISEAGWHCVRLSRCTGNMQQAVIPRPLVFNRHAAC